jgi:hypothetical protein
MPLLGYKAGTYLRLGASAWHLHEDLDLNDCARLFGVLSSSKRWVPGPGISTLFDVSGIQAVPGPSLPSLCCTIGMQGANPTPQTVQTTAPTPAPAFNPATFMPQPGTYWASHPSGGAMTFKYMAPNGTTWYWSNSRQVWAPHAILPGPNPIPVHPSVLMGHNPPIPLSPPGGWPSAGGAATKSVQWPASTPNVQAIPKSLGLGQALHDHFKDRLKTPASMGACSKCGVPLHAMLDAYYGRNMAAAGMCSSCRPRGA